MKHPSRLWSAAAVVCAAMMLLTACDDSSDRQARITGPDSLTAATVGTAFTTNFTARGGGVTFSVSTGTLPGGLTLTQGGLYSGTPTAAGTFTFTIMASNSRGSDTRQYSQVVNAAAGGGTPVTPALPPTSGDTSALLTSNQLAALASNNPAGLETGVTITGVAAGETLVGIDRRPQNGYLYGLGYNPTAGTVQVYAISAATTLATPIGTPPAFVAADGTTAVRIGTDANTRFGFDFNPTVDRIRVTNTAGQTFRLNPNNGAGIDGDTVNAGLQMDGALNGTTTTLQGSAYTNSAQNATVTTLYGLDPMMDILCIQNPPNAGTQTGCQPLSAPLDSVGGFDISPAVTVATSNTPVTTGSGLATVQITGQTTSSLVSINLTSGMVTPVGTISSAVLGIALQQPAATPAVVLSADGTQLIRFPVSNPAASSAPVTIAGVTAGEQLVGIDFRPLTGQLFSFGVNATANTGTVYILDPQTGAATVVGTAGSIAFVDANNVAVDLPPVTAGYGFDFNPTVDRIRVVTGTGLNFRLNPLNGMPVDGNLNNTTTPPAGINTDGLINGLPSGSTGVSATAYTNSYGQGTGLVTTQYVLDAGSNTLFIQNPPNAGTLTAGMPVTLNGAALDFTDASGFDIPPEVRVATSNTAASGTGHAALTVGGATRLYAINLTNGQATDLGPISIAVGGLAVGQLAVR
jgi:hypothetical protein